MQALEGVRVLELTQFEAGPSCGETLAWLGAEVIKVEPPGKGEATRWSMSDKAGVDSYYFMLLNANKKSITLDLSQSLGREVLLAILEDFEIDVLLENYGPGVMEKYHLGYDELKLIQPELIYCSIKGFGADGPYSQYKSFDMIAQATGGNMSVTGFAEAFPLKSGGTMGDTGAAQNAAIGILAALYQRKTSGIGQLVDISMQESVVNFTRLAMISSYQTHAPAPRTGNSIGGGTPGQIFGCKFSSEDVRGGDNDFCYILCITPESWDRLCKVIPALNEITRFASKFDRTINADDLHSCIELWTTQHTKYEVFKILGEAGVPCGPVLSSLEILEDPHLLERGHIVEVNHPTRGLFKMPGCPVRLSDSERKVEPAPLLGQHNDEIYSQLMHPELLKGLKGAKVI